MESSEETSSIDRESVGQKIRRFKRLILGLLVLGLVTVACLGTVAYFTLGPLTNNFEPIAEAVPAIIDRPVHNKIAFVGNDDNIWYSSPDGQELHHVTVDGRGYQFPTWAPDGSYLAFVG
jgi:hypothetical protein